MRKEKIEIKKLGINGEGIGYVDKKVCFIDNALPGEIVEVELSTSHRKFYKGKVLKYIKTSPDRVQSICKESQNCQGCALTSLLYDKQLLYKKGVLKDALKKYTDQRVDRLPIQNMIENPQQTAYKKVVSLPVTYFKGKIGVGIYQRESKYLTLMNQCPMQDSLINQTLLEIETILNDCGIRDYNDKVKKGLRFLRLKNIDGAIQVLLVTGQDGISEEVTKKISQLPQVKSIYLTINTSRYQDFELQGYKKIYGQATLPFQCFNQQYLYSVKSEFPINPQMEEKKLSIIKSFIPVNASVLSLYCGVGLLENAIDNDVVGVDNQQYHIKDANDNAKFLRKDNARFLCKDIDEAIVTQCKKNHFDVLVIQKGTLTTAIKQSMIISKIPHILYVSDHPSSLAKDLQDINSYYDIEKIIPLDTYPNTLKMEVIVKLKRK